MRSTRPVLLLTPFLLLPLSLHAQQHRASDPKPEAPATSLPVTHVSLYKNGVGFFEHTGHVTGNASVTIDFTSGQLNDVLQSLTAIDLNGGRISGAAYNSTTPLDQQLKTLPLSLDDNPTSGDFYSAIRGARVEVHSGAVSITGRLLSVEVRKTPLKSSDSTETMDRFFLTVVADSGETRTLELTPATSVKLLDTALHNDVTRYLQLLDANRSQGLRHLTLDDRGTGSRELRVSYISEVPIWKSTYRILFTDGSPTATIQGWSVVDNTTGTDWTNVQLSLIAGAPQSFIQPISQPIYSRRPEVPIAQEAQLQPQTFASAMDSSSSGIHGKITDQTGAVIPNASIVATNLATGEQRNGSTDAQGNFSLAVPSGTYRVQISSPGFSTYVQNNVTSGASIHVPLQVGSASTTVEVTASAPMLETQSASVATRSIRSFAKLTPGLVPSPPPPPPSYEDLASGSIDPNTQAAGFDDFFSYNLSEPITIRKNESALVPILQAKLPVDSVTLVHSNGVSTSQPLRALWITNNSSLTFDRGSFSIIEGGTFGGEGLLDPIHPNEKRLLSYAADQAVHVSTEGGLQTDKIDQITIANRILVFHQAQIRNITYVVHNAASTTRTVVLEHPMSAGYALTSTTKPEETTSDVYRFRLTAARGETVKLPISSMHRGITTYELAQSDDDEFALILRSSGNNPALIAALQPVFDARRRENEAQNAFDVTEATLKNLHADEERQRANITALANADKGSRDRFVRDLDHTEDEINIAQHRLDDQNKSLEAIKAELSSRIRALQFDEHL